MLAKGDELPNYLMGFVLFSGLLLYFLPALIAKAREHQNRSAITALNVLAGWTFVGWVVALVWALTAVEKPGRRRVYYVVDEDEESEEEQPPRSARRRRAE